MLITGIVHITGEHDTGKTSFGLECDTQFNRMLLLDNDEKSREMAKEHRIDYHDLVELGKGKRELEFHRACLELIDAIQPDQYDAIIWDTWTPFAKTCHAHVLNNPTAFKLNWSRQGGIKGSQQWLEARRYEAEILHRLQQLVPFVAIITHLRPHYLNKVATEKEEPACSEALVRVSNFRIWLRHNPSSPVPIGLVLKRIDKKVVIEGKPRTICILPRKITPLPGERSLWDSIARYFADPIGQRSPTEDETPNAFELSVLDGTLTDDQKHTLNLMLRASAVSRMPRVSAASGTSGMIVERNSVDIVIVARARELRKGGKNFAAIASETGLSVPQVIEICASEQLTHLSPR